MEHIQVHLTTDEQIATPRPDFPGLQITLHELLHLLACSLQNSTLMNQSFLSAEPLQRGRRPPDCSSRV